MTEVEARAASQELQMVLQTTPSGSWQLRTIARILLKVIGTGGPIIPDADSPKDKPSRTLHRAGKERHR